MLLDVILDGCRITGKIPVRILFKKFQIAQKGIQGKEILPHILIPVFLNKRHLYTVLHPVFPALQNS